jgi:hypothetical protein
MEKLRLDVDALRVESFDAGEERAVRGTAHAHQVSECSCVNTCGAASRGQETYEKYPRTWYACCV